MKKQLIASGAIAALTLMGAGCGTTAPAAPAQPTAAPTAAPAAQAPAELFPVGTKVLAKWKNGGRWYPGTVATAASGAYSINYDDGDKESGLSVASLAKTPVAAATVKVGDVVIAKWTNGGFYEGTVTAVTAGKATVKWTDGSAPIDVNLTDIAFAGK